jgi:Holliday junction resolvasome RuvABC DNA-binding subunit
MLGILVEAGFDTVGKIAESNVEILSGIPGIGQKKAESLIESARVLSGKDV